MKLPDMARLMGRRLAESAEEHGRPNSFSIGELAGRPMLAMLAGRALARHLDQAILAAGFEFAVSGGRIHVDAGPSEPDLWKHPIGWPTEHSANGPLGCMPCSKERRKAHMCTSCTHESHGKTCGGLVQLRDGQTGTCSCEAAP